jgi:hypothetical protein
MKNAIYSLLVAILFCSLTQSIVAQQSIHDDSYNIERLKQNLNSAALRSGGAIFVPIRFHVVAEDNGTPPVSYAYLLDLLCNINQVFAPKNIIFYMQNEANSPFDLIKNTNLTNDQVDQLNPLILSKNKKDAINIWFVKTIKEKNLIALDYVQAYYSTLMAIISKFKKLAFLSILTILLSMN